MMYELEGTQLQYVPCPEALISLCVQQRARTESGQADTLLSIHVHAHAM